MRRSLRTSSKRGGVDDEVKSEQSSTEGDPVEISDDSVSSSPLEASAAAIAESPADEEKPEPDYEEPSVTPSEEETPTATETPVAPTEEMPVVSTQAIPSGALESAQMPAYSGGAFVPPTNPASYMGKPENKVVSLLKRIIGTKAGKIGLGVAAALALIFTLFSTHVICFHEWREATCTAPQTCAICHRTQGDPLGHEWKDATCTEPQTCSRCGWTNGEALGHEPGKWTVATEATCTAEGEEHTKCTRCGEDLVQAIPMVDHEFGEWATTKEPTCTEEGTKERKCKNCDETETESIEMVDHTPGDWQVIKDVSVTSSGDVIPGKKARVCTVCGKELETEEITMDLTMSQKNALRTAASYLSWAGFSYKGLVDQLEFEGFSHEDATFAADHCGADWNEQAAMSAESYMSWASFSRQGLIDQLMFEGFTQEQAEYGAAAVGY